MKVPPIVRVSAGMFNHLTPNLTEEAMNDVKALLLASAVAPRLELD